jgi:RHS repeat-associated protein
MMLAKKACLSARRHDTAPTSSVLYFLHGDHLGSVSVTTCGAGCGTAGTVLARQKFDAWGNVRGGLGTMPTDVGFTAQRSDATGLMYFKARYYAPSLGRFLSADTIVPGAGNPQSLNRYTYVSNRPLNRVDPSGHRDLDCIAHPEVCGRYITNPYVRFSGDWAYAYQEIVISSAKLIEHRLKSADAAAARREARAYRFEDSPVSYLDFCSICGLSTPGRAFQAVYGDVIFRHIEGNPIEGWAETHLDWVGNGCSMGHICYDDSVFTEAGNMAQVSHNATHELGHGIDQRGGRAARANLAAVWDNENLRRANRGFAGDFPGWQQSTGGGEGEVFADMFLGWVYNTWGPGHSGANRSRYMEANMPSIIALAVSHD